MGDKAAMEERMNDDDVQGATHRRQVARGRKGYPRWLVEGERVRGPRR